MKNKFYLSASSVLVLLALSGCNTAPQQKVAEKNAQQASSFQRDHGDGFADRYWFIDEFDQNGDGELSRKEFDDARAKRLTGMDLNKDQRIDENEYVEEYALRLEKQLSEERKGQVSQTAIRFESVDTDKNAKMTWAEYEASGSRTFTHLDKAGLGVIDANTPVPEMRSAPNANEKPRPRSVLSMPSSHSVSGFIAIYDKNGDGQVTRAEFDQDRKNSFAATDTNKDSWISAEEYSLEFENRLDRQAKNVRTGQIKQAHVRFGALDKDKNGDLTLQEFGASGERIFSGWDLDKDGIVNAKDPLPKREHKQEKATAAK